MVLAPVVVGTPQGLPASPLISVIYVAWLHQQTPSGLTLSFVDDFAVTVFSPSHAENSHLLQARYARLKIAGLTLGLGSRYPKLN